MANPANAMAARDVIACVRARIIAEDMWQIPGVGSDSVRTHLISSEPFPLTATQLEAIVEMGDALVGFYAAANDLYLRSGCDWARDYLDKGKPDDMLRHARMNYQKSAFPAVIRPDILITDSGFSITELDSVPGGVGQLDCLAAAYEDAGYELVGSPRGMRDGFASMVRSVRGDDDPVCAVVVSDESIDYLPEMTYLARELRKTGLRAYTVRPKDVTFTEQGLHIEAEGHELRVDVLYRFFELFDLLNIPKSELVSYAARKKLVAVTPPYKHFLEEKILLALLHHSSLADHWAGAMGEHDYELLKSAVAPTFILDNRSVPPHAQISGFEWRGKPINDWRQLKDATQLERRLVLKPSGFSELAWGSRGVVVGHDVSAQDWGVAIETALGSFDRLPYVLQPFQETALMGVECHDESSQRLRTMPSRVRLCPYYFVVDGRARLGGILATACPKDKKLIHGMTDAVMMPCRVGNESI